MSLFKNLFGKKPEPEKRPASRPFTPATLPPVKEQPAKPASIDPATAKNMIKVFDAYGRELYITKETWRKDVLPGSIKSNWNNPDGLYGIIYSALNDGFRSDVIAAAEQLYKIDPQPERGTCVWGIVLKEEGRLDAAEKVFQDFTSRHGENGPVLTNLAKIYSNRKDDAKAEEILWHALEVDPNQDNGLGWYVVIYRERGGEEAGKEALRRAAALPGSWRAQMWLAQAELKSRNLEGALDYYHETLSRVGKPIPGDLLMSVSGDLGNAGHLPELLQLTEPHFNPALHGLQVGNNLIKAHLDLGQLDAARRILDQLYALKRPDWQKGLSFWETEIAKARVAVVGERKGPLQMAMLAIEGPVWLKPSSPAAELFPAKAGDATLVAFLGCSAEIATNSKRIQQQMADAPGRLSRALPLFLAEQVEFGSQARVRTLVPWITGESPGFVVSGVAWKDDDAANYARQGDPKSDYVVNLHLNATVEPWSVQARLVRTIDAKLLGTLTGSFLQARPEEGVPALARELLGLLAAHAEAQMEPPTPLYQIPEGINFPYYLLRLEQLLAVRCGTMDGVRSDFLSGPREIIDGNIQQCLTCPQNVPARLLLAQTLLAMKKVRPDILPEFKDKLALLQKQKPLPEPAQSVVQRMLNEALAA